MTSKYEISIDLFIQSSSSEGNPIGNWITIPTEDEVLKKHIDKIVQNKEDQSYIVTDDTATFPILETIDVFKLNKFLRNCKKFNLFKTLMIQQCGNFDYVLKLLEHNKMTFIENVDSIEDAAEKYSCTAKYIDGIGMIPSRLMEYMDFNSIANHMETALGWTYFPQTRAAISLNEK